MDSQVDPWFKWVDLSSRGKKNLFFFIDDVLKSSVSCKLQIAQIGTSGIRINGPNRRHISQKLSENQVSK